MGDLTKNLSRQEFACPCGCADTPVDFDLPNMIQDCIDHFAFQQKKVLYDYKGPQFQRVACTITSGYRCAEYNAAVDGASKTSKHTLGMAADHRMELVYSDGTRKPIPDNDIADYYEHRYPDAFGIGRYSNRTHIDVRKTATRWDTR
jgi:uncharacterized protein YcbK (DUF882 family)